MNRTIESGFFVSLTLAFCSPLSAQSLELQDARSAIMGQLSLIASNAEEAVASGDPIADSLRYEMEYAAAMLAALPWLFPQPTASMPEDDLSSASETIWQNFDSFVELTVQAKDNAEIAAFSESDAEFSESVTAMQSACTTCHDLFTVTNY